MYYFIVWRTKPFFFSCKRWQSNEVRLGLLNRLQYSLLKSSERQRRNYSNHQSAMKRAGLTFQISNNNCHPTREKKTTDRFYTEKCVTTFKIDFDHYCHYEMCTLASSFLSPYPIHATQNIFISYKLWAKSIKMWYIFFEKLITYTGYMPINVHSNNREKKTFTEWKWWM